jgi:hypothetical protein
LAIIVSPSEPIVHEDLDGRRRVPPRAKHHPVLAALFALASARCGGASRPDAAARMDASADDASALADTIAGDSAEVAASDASAQDVPLVPFDAAVPAARVAIPTFGYEPGRSAANRGEGVLSVAALRDGRLGRDPGFAPALDGDVYAQPLYLPALTVAGAAHDTLFVVTQANSVFALDASTGATLWRTNLGTPVPRRSQPCGNIDPQTGILGTPAIDRAAGTLYAVAFTTPDVGATKVYAIHALEVSTGAERAGYPQPIAPPATNGVSFDPNPTGERGAMAVVDGRIYVPFGGLSGDCGSYHGWVVGIDAAAPTHQTAFATPGRGSGIWAPGGVASDGAALYVATGNGFDATSLGEHVLRLGAGALGPTTGLSAAEFFTPSDRASLDSGDADLGSIAPVVLPDHAGSSTPHLLFQAGKAGVGYLLNRDDLGGLGSGDGSHGEGLYSMPLFAGGMYGSSAAWSDGTDVYVFVPGAFTRAAPCTGANGVMALRLGRGTSGASTLQPAWCTASLTNATPAVSSNGDRDGVLWVTQGLTTTFRAYSIADGTALLTATDAPTIRKWVPPVVADGRVYITGTQTIAMYRLLR